MALVSNRLCEPTSEHGMARWLETHYVCDRTGQRWLPEWREDAKRLASRRPRVRVTDRQLRQWYGTLDRLVAQKKQIEQELFLRLRHLFALKVDLVFYDLTSTYFEGNGPAGLAQHGYSRDSKPRNRQVLVGVVMIDGWPIAHHVFEGNRRDSATVQSVLKDLEERFGLRRVIFVGDRGMVTAEISSSCGRVGKAMWSDSTAAGVPRCLATWSERPVPGWSVGPAWRPARRPRGPRPGCRK